MDKQQFVECLGQILTHTCWGVTGAHYEKGIWDETAVVEFKNREALHINITGDSNAQIILDVLRALVSHIGL